MNTDKVKGTMDDAIGRAKRQAGEWTDDTKTQAEGAARQVKGKAEKAWGTVKDAAHDAKADADREHAKNLQAQKDREHEREHTSGRS